MSWFQVQLSFSIWKNSCLSCSWIALPYYKYLVHRWWLSMRVWWHRLLCLVSMMKSSCVDSEECPLDNGYMSGRLKVTSRMEYHTIPLKYGILHTKYNVGVYYIRTYVHFGITHTYVHKYSLFARKDKVCCQCQITNCVHAYMYGKAKYAANIN